MKYIQLGNLVELKQGMAINAKSNHLVSKEETPLALLRIADMPTKSKVIFMSENTPERFIASEDDIIYTRTGQVGLVFRKQQGVVHNNCFRIIPNSEEKLDKGYLYWYLSLSSIRNFANSIASGSAQPDLPHSTFKKIRIWLTQITSQMKIAKILDQYELLIENNNKRIRLLEQMAENLYKEWFVRFRFPGYEGVEFENGLPKDWKIERLSDIVDIIMGQSPKSENYNTNCEGLPFHQGVGSYGDFYLIDDIYSTKGNRIAEANSIIFSVRAPVGRINITLNKIILGRGVASINSVKGYNAYLLWMLKNQFQQEDIIGNGSIFASVTKKDLFGFKILMPNENLIQKFDSIASGIESVMRKISLINRNLEKQRDMLLPRLMSGKLEV